VESDVEATPTASVSTFFSKVSKRRTLNVEHRMPNSLSLN
jgi:hypothetical protein